MKYTPLHSDFYKINRRNVVSEMREQSVAILVSNDEFPRCGDTMHPFRQNSELLYLCGIDQEETTLMLAPWHPNPDYREVLFIKNPSPEMVVWYGHRLSKEEASAISGIRTILFTDSFNTISHDIIVNSQSVYLHLPENPRLKIDLPTQEICFAKKLKKEYPLHTYERLAPILYPLRNVKHPEELRMLKRACEITGAAFLRASQAVKPGKYEYEIEAELTYEMLRQGASGHSFAPIVASGKDTCILHYIKNDKRMEDGDLLLLDFGAEYGNYAGDCSRTIPVNGKFSPRQKAIYNAVLAIYKETIPLFKPGMTIHKINDFVFRRMEEEMIKLGLFTAEEVKNQNPAAPLFKKYYMHNTSHFIGMDVHDVGQRDWIFQPGQVLSCEPGIYIAEEGIGVRIETNVVVGETPIDLMEGLAVEIKEIEKLISNN
ncbi:MAG: aminopeptidase P N-terminal domain-containing protein [Bacteroidales bacterium]|jgi:Xaa-Pro aminopeptidase|nr:aminopeptidase P N-terminal domain-containing protein [Bacteroidales bacterium]